MEADTCPRCPDRDPNYRDLSQEDQDALWHAHAHEHPYKAERALIRWEIDAPDPGMTPVEAARWAFETIRQRDTLATVFTIHDTDGTVHTVDLDEE